MSLWKTEKETQPEQRRSCEEGDSERADAATGNASSSQKPEETRKDSPRALRGSVALLTSGFSAALFFQNAKQTPTSGPFHVLFPLPGTVSCHHTVSHPVPPPQRGRRHHPVTQHSITFSALQAALFFSFSYCSPCQQDELGHSA